VIVRRRFIILRSTMLTARDVVGRLLIGAMLPRGNSRPSVAKTKSFPGSVNLGGPIATASGVLFIGATLDRMIRVYDIEAGRELWSAPLPAGARATPMTYDWKGRQYVVIAAGGGEVFGKGDQLIAFALPRR